MRYEHTNIALYVVKVMVKVNPYLAYYYDYTDALQLIKSMFITRHRWTL